MSEQRIKRFVFWVGGVVLPAASEAALAILAPERAGDIDLRLRLLDLEKELCFGALDAEAFCRGAVEASGASLAPGDLLDALAARVEPLPGMPKLIGELAATVEMALASDYPRRWLEPALEQGRLARWFADERAFVIAERGVPADSGVLFEALVGSGVITPGSSLWIDHNPARTAVALRRGIDAGIFVDAGRLYRDLGLWGLVPFGSRL